MLCKTSITCINHMTIRVHVSEIDKSGDKWTDKENRTDKHI